MFIWMIYHGNKDKHFEHSQVIMYWQQILKCSCHGDKRYGIKSVVFCRWINLISSYILFLELKHNLLNCCLLYLLWSDCLRNIIHHTHFQEELCSASMWVHVLTLYSCATRSTTLLESSARVPENAPSPSSSTSAWWQWEQINYLTTNESVMPLTLAIQFSQ